MSSVPEQVRIAIIGGTGIYNLESLSDIKEVKIQTPFGYPSDSITVGSLSGVRVAFIPRHGRGHYIPPPRSTVASISTPSKPLE